MAFMCLGAYCRGLRQYASEPACQAPTPVLHDESVFSCLRAHCVRPFVTPAPPRYLLGAVGAGAFLVDRAGHQHVAWKGGGEPALYRRAGHLR